MGHKNLTLISVTLNPLPFPTMGPDLSLAPPPVYFEVAELIDNVDVHYQSMVLGPIRPALERVR